MADTSNKQKVLASQIGRRKTAVASVRLVSGDGKMEINGKSASQYFTFPQALERLAQPFNLLNLKKYDVVAKVSGSGLRSQLDAVVLGIARALVVLKGDLRPELRTSGLLTRDSRERQRRMVGTGGKARRRKSSPKR